MIILILMSLMLKTFKRMYCLAYQMGPFFLLLTWLTPEYRESEDILYINPPILDP